MAEPTLPAIDPKTPLGNPMICTRGVLIERPAGLFGDGKYNAWTHQSKAPRPVGLGALIRTMRCSVTGRPAEEYAG